MASGSVANVEAGGVKSSPQPGPQTSQNSIKEGHNFPNLFLGVPALLSICRSFYQDPRPAPTQFLGWEKEASSHAHPRWPRLSQNLHETLTALWKTQCTREIASLDYAKIAEAVAQLIHPTIVKNRGEHTATERSGHKEGTDVPSTSHNGYRTAHI